MNFDKDLIQNLAGLCRLECSEEEADAMLKDLEKIVSYVEGLQDVDTEDVQPCDHVIADMVNVTRPDEVGETLDRKTFLDNSPDHVGGMIRVPSIIRKNTDK